MLLKDKATEVVIAAESRLRELAQEALASGDYVCVEEITRLAKALGGLRMQGPRSVPDPSGATARTSRGIERDDPRQQEIGPPLVPDVFPRFERQSKRLVKLGWSERDKRIYEHRAPLEAVEEICKRFAEKGSGKRVLKIDRMLPMKTEEGEELPSYQVYLVLKWLQQRGVVQKQGKDGYVITDPDFSIREVWDSTPIRG